ncbi:MAG: AmmeMemoRadiSam system protein B [Candidatus Omnitrophota bacterium]|nr:AmmeMemoRadiSam system protein B [Candidatus Omnitrophota bacterium]
MKNSKFPPKADPAVAERIKKYNLKLVIFKFLIFIFNFSLFFFCFSFSCFAQEIKDADLAGSWYPANKEELSALLDSFLSVVSAQEINGDVIALIQPHAGLVFSGPVAAYGVKAVKGLGIKTVIIIGFAHRKQFDGVSVYNQGAFDTPLGRLNIDKELSEALISQNKKIKSYPSAFDEENSIELQLPFIKKAFPDALIVPVAIGDQDFSTVRILSDALYNVLKDRKDCLLIASTDMSHYLSYLDAIERDKRTIGILKQMSADSIFRENILSGGNMFCGVSGVAAVVLAGQKLGADSIKILKYANSGDTAGDKSRVVGYLSAVIYKSKIKNEESKMKNDNTGVQNEEDKKEGTEGMFTDAEQKRLLDIARQTIAEYLTTGKTKDFHESDPVFLEEKGAFVTLRKHGDLRGCIGNIMGKGPLYKTVRDMAIESAVNDPRFKAVTKEEFKDIEIEVSVLSVPAREFNPANIIMGKHGVIVKKGFYSGVFLPQVAAETGWSREEFLSNLCSHKAGLPPDAWKDKDTELYTFTAEVFSE